MPRITQKEIAESLGLKQATVSRVLAGSGTVSERTRQRILDTARDLGYRPDLAARGIRARSGGYHAVAYAMSTNRNYNMVHPELLYAVEEELRHRERHCLLASIDHTLLDDPEHVSRLLSSIMADALILAWVADLPPEAPPVLARMHIPWARVNALGDSNCVNFDDRGAAAEATQRIIALGHRRIAFLDLLMSTEQDPNYFHYSNHHRWQGFAAAAQEAGLSARRLSWPLRPAAADRVPLLRAVLAAPDRPTAVLCYDYDENLVPLAFAARELGLDIPQQLSVVAFSSRPSSQIIPSPTHIKLDFNALGYAAVDMIVAALDNPGVLQPSRTLPLTMAAGSSLMPPTISERQKASKRRTPPR